jgi:hypothetical protein
MSESSSICLVMPYFGQWPFWMPFFLQSCRFNPSVDWLLYTDCQPLDHCPENVRVVQISLNDYCRKVSTKLSIDFSPTKAYKLCDIRRPWGSSTRMSCGRTIFGVSVILMWSTAIYVPTSRMSACKATICTRLTLGAYPVTCA